MSPRKQTTEPKMLILVSIFSGEVTSYTDTSYCIHILWEVYRSVFFMGHPVYEKYNTLNYLIRKHQYCFHWKLAITEVEQVFQTGSQEVHN